MFVNIHNTYISGTPHIAVRRKRTNARENYVLILFQRGCLKQAMHMCVCNIEQSIFMNVQRMMYEICPIREQKSLINKHFATSSRKHFGL